MELLDPTPEGIMRVAGAGGAGNPELELEADTGDAVSGKGFSRLTA
jgi:hypothetical protein